MARILVVTEDANLAATVREALSTDMHRVYVASPVDFKSYLTSADLVVVDIKPGQEESFSWQHAEQVLGAQVRMTVALLSDKQLDSYRGGTSDFILKPLREPELRVRVRRLLEKQKAIEHEIIRSGLLEIDVTNCDVVLAGRRIDLTFTEYQLLKYLAGHAGRVLTRESILHAVWGPDYFGGDRTVDVHIQRLRGKIDDGQTSFIQTVRNLGYRFKKI